jgi:hypothetical protein
VFVLEIYLTPRQTNYNTKFKIGLFKIKKTKK